MGKVNLAKRSVVDLQKDVGRALRKHNLGGMEMDVVLIFDKSGSMEDEYKSGLAQLCLDRCYALAKTLDADGKMPVYVFHNTAWRAVPVTENNVGAYVKDVLMRYDWGGTSYSAPLKLLLEDAKVPGKQRGWSAVTSMFSSSSASAGGAPRKPTLALFITDGDNSDKEETTRIMNALAQSAPVLVKFIGLDTGNNVRFPYLEYLDDRKAGSNSGFDNADFFKWDASVTDDVLYEKLVAELDTAVSAMKAQSLL
jgi:hypothetical protein